MLTCTKSCVIALWAASPFSHYNVTFVVDRHFIQFGFGQKEGFCRRGICFGMLVLGCTKSKIEGQLGLREIWVRIFGNTLYVPDFFVYFPLTRVLIHVVGSKYKPLN